MEMAHAFQAKAEMAFGNERSDGLLLHQRMPGIPLDAGSHGARH
jgi:hypothetical protein